MSNCPGCLCHLALPAEENPVFHVRTLLSSEESLTIIMLKAASDLKCAIKLTVEYVQESALTSKAHLHAPAGALGCDGQSRAPQNVLRRGIPLARHRSEVYHSILQSESTILHCNAETQQKPVVATMCKRTQQIEFPNSMR